MQPFGEDFLKKIEKTPSHKNPVTKFYIFVEKFQNFLDSENSLTELLHVFLVKGRKDPA